jgi:methyl-galactoside transport system permease protein
MENNKINRMTKFKTWVQEKDWLEWATNNAIYLVMSALIIAAIIVEPRFLQINVLKNILTQSSVKLILALGVGGIIILQGTDLSLGRITGLSAVIAATLLQTVGTANKFFPELGDLPIIVPLLAVMIISAILSMINGFAVAKFKIHPFIATLGMSVVIYGVNLLYTEGVKIGGLRSDYSKLINYRIPIIGDFEIPMLVIYAGITTVVVWTLWNKTTFGKNMYAVGGNPEAAEVSGVSVFKTTMYVYLLAGLLYGLGGFLETARISSVDASTGLNYELDAIAACVVGGISFSGGIGKIRGAITGVLLFTIMVYAMTFLGIEAAYQYIVKGLIIVIAVALDTKKYLKKS